jgi:hypothetical protein
MFLWSGRGYATQLAVPLWLGSRGIVTITRRTWSTAFGESDKTVFAYLLWTYICDIIGIMESNSPYIHALGAPGLSQLAPVHPRLQTHVLGAEQLPPF